MSASHLTSAATTLFEESGLGTSHEPIDEPLVSMLLEKHYGLGGGLERLATEKDDTFRLRTDSRSYLVKVAPPSEPEAVVALQTAVMRFLENAAPELPVQRVRLTVDGRDHILAMMEDGRARVLRMLDFVEGALLADLEPDTTQLTTVGRILGQIDVALESFSHPAAQRGLAWDLKHFHELTGLLEHTSNAEHRQMAQEIFRVFGQAIVPRLNDLETQVIHGDYSPYNVVVDPDDDAFVTGVIDFGDTVRSAVIFDPAVCVANLIGRVPDEPWADACAVVTGYDSARPIAPTEVPLLPVAGLARLTLRALMASWRAERVPDRRVYLLEHAKDDWLNVERAMAVPLDDVVAQLQAGLDHRG